MLMKDFKNWIELYAKYVSVLYSKPVLIPLGILIIITTVCYAITDLYDISLTLVTIMVSVLMWIFGIMTVLAIIFILGFVIYIRI